MTKRRQKDRSAIIHVTKIDGVYRQDVHLALMEQLFEMRGSDTVASYLAKQLRDPSPARKILDLVVRWLDPENDDYLKLILVGRRNKERWTKRVNDKAIISLAKRYRQERIKAGKHDSKRFAVSKVAKELGLSTSKVWKVMQAKPSSE